MTKQEDTFEEKETVVEPAEVEAAPESFVAEESAPLASADAVDVQDTGEVSEPEMVTSSASDAEAVEAVSASQSVEDEPNTSDAGDAETEASQSESSDDDDDGKRVVRMLAVGQQVDGVVKRIADFGAFVDIGVGRDGLLHISELSLQRVAKVSDVLSKNQEIQPWIKKLDRERNRISLTLIDPDQKTIRDLQAGELVTGTVTRILPYGAFIDIGIGRDALLHVREMSNKYVEKPEDVVQVGETFEARIIEVSRRRGRVDLSLKGLRDVPEEELVEQEVSIDEEIEDIEDEYAEVEVLSPMELAFKRAVEAEGDEIRVERKQGKRNRKSDARAIQDEIIARTLETSRK
ncbi:MAG: S1 RNA-binding domain-containing protein [Caldilineaceae bacterium]|jgi:transcriptional accessory protein Tex/SPT6